MTPLNVIMKHVYFVFVRFLSGPSLEFLILLWEFWLCFYLIYCRFPLGVREVVKTKEPFLQRHQLPSAPSAHYWCIVGTAWRGQWLAVNNEAGGQHKGHAHRMMGKSRGGSRCCHRGHTGGERETADVSLSISASDGFVLCRATGKKRQKLQLLTGENPSLQLRQIPQVSMCLSRRFSPRLLPQPLNFDFPAKCFLVCL